MRVKQGYHCWFFITRVDRPALVTTKHQPLAHTHFNAHPADRQANVSERGLLLTFPALVTTSF